MDATSHIRTALAAYDVQAIDTLIGDINPPAELMTTQTDRKIAEEQRKTYEVQEAAQKQRQQLVRQTSLADIQQSVVGAEQGGLRAAGKEALASILQSAAVRSNRAEINAVADGLTGLYNHRYLNERLGEELRRSEELAAPLSLLFGELDELRELIDALGHDAGDDALSSTAHIIEQSIRHVDLASRYGEEEFVVALIGTDAEDAVDVAERIRQRVHETRVGSSPEPLSISIGVAAFPSDGLTMEELLDKAEWAMHVARRLGRNRVVAFPTGPSSYPELPV